MFLLSLEDTGLQRWSATYGGAEVERATGVAVDGSGDAVLTGYFYAQANFGGGTMALDTAGSPNDYPHGYVVRLSTDGQGWEEVARLDQNDRTLEVSFSPRPARYIRVEQTGSTDNWWWSIHGVTIRD